MQVQSVLPSIPGMNYATMTGPTKFGYADLGGDAGSLSATNQRNTSSGAPQGVVLTSEKYSSEKLLLQYTNQDGDTLSLSAESIDYQKAILAANGNASPDDWKKIIQAIKDEYSKMKGQIVATLFGNENSDSAASSGTVQDPKAFDETKEIPGLPDYWNAENTAQRIVDFATSFLKDFQGGTDEFVSMIKDAIEKGFSQAKDILGKDLPDPVTKLVAKTHALVMEKIDNWAKAQSASTADANDGSSAA